MIQKASDAQDKSWQLNKSISSSIDNSTNSDNNTITTPTVTSPVAITTKPFGITTKTSTPNLFMSSVTMYGATFTTSSGTLPLEATTHTGSSASRATTSISSSVSELSPFTFQSTVPSSDNAPPEYGCLNQLKGLN
ncbi:unnamed protein product [Didymodactylos carnosus]|uniref:Uncharacterized protein n=1 Tax=Didymodactylos carnosus TaxID=1234261 RepID=A0A814BQ39_9BILA|nr:unnamed protein product [Didymodactylos carnosus]CAF3709640.1 unnamed protein product [Didymodactylos carnosus]